MLRAFAQRIRTYFDMRFLDRLCATHGGRAFLLNALVDAEEADEQGVFDHLIAEVSDPTLKKVIETHRDDEVRHAELMRVCLRRHGCPRQPGPVELQIVPYIARALGDGGARLLARPAVWEAYAFLEVLEQRAVEEYPRFAAALGAIDPETGVVILEIADDEARHVKYARAVSRRYAPDPDTLERTRAKFRAAEAWAFDVHGRATIRHAVAHGLLAGSTAERALWRAIAA